MIKPLAGPSFALLSCRCVNLQRTTRVMMESWVCAFAEILQEELHVVAYAGEGQLLNSSSSADPMEKWSWSGAMIIR